MFRSYQRVYRLSRWTRRHFTFLGHSLLILMGGAGAFGIDTKVSSGYQLFTLLLVLFIFALIASRLMKTSLSARRDLPQYFTLGEPARYRVTLTNNGKTLLYGLALIDRLDEDPPSARTDIERFLQLEGLSWLRRRISYRRWLRYLRHRRGGFIAETGLPELYPNTPVSMALEFTPERRGVLRFDGLSIARPDSLGLFRRLYHIRHDQRCLVLPRRYPMSPIDLPGNRRYQAGGVALASSVGDSSEFVSLREYRKGDPLNTIHWKNFARHGRLIVREYQDEYFVRRGLVLDTFASGLAPEIFEAAVSVAASVCLAERGNDSLLDLMFVGLDTYRFTTGRGVDHMPHIQEVLASVESAGEGDFERLHRAVEKHLPMCSSMVCVLLQWDEARRDMLHMLALNGIPTLAFVLHEGALEKASIGATHAAVRLIDINHLARDLSQS